MPVRTPIEDLHFRPAFADGQTMSEPCEKNPNLEAKESHRPKLQPATDNEILGGNDAVLAIKPEK
jgi:hypothetical protein